ncbi:hypothetical protein GC176_20000 [bacterium]|nr:hypothetical protein [bacterium]
MDQSVEDEIRELLASGNKIAAIKRFREETGVGLAEAKAAVEALEAGRTLPVSGESLPKSDRMDESELTDQVIRLLERGEKIQAVKLYREQAGTGLKDAKDAVERIGEQNGIPSASGTGCFGVILLCLTLSLAGYVLTHFV